MGGRKRGRKGEREIGGSGRRSCIEQEVVGLRAQIFGRDGHTKRFATLGNLMLKWFFLFSFCSIATLAPTTYRVNVKHKINK